MKSEDDVLNDSVIDTLKLHVFDLYSYLLSAVGLTSNSSLKDNISVSLIFNIYDSFVSWLAFDDFQIKLLKGFMFILFANLFLIYLSWRVYGKKISERFMKPATSKTIEDLKKSVSLLKLPKEHSPRV